MKVLGVCIEHVFFQVVPIASWAFWEPADLSSNLEAFIISKTIFSFTNHQFVRGKL